MPLQRAIDFGNFTSLALKAWLLIDVREGIAKDRKEAVELVEEGARLGCHHCQGVMAHCLLEGFGCHQEARIVQLALADNGELRADGEADSDSQDEPQCVALARESAGKGSRYGQ